MDIFALRRLVFIVTISTLYFSISAQHRGDSSALEQLKKELTTAATDMDRIHICRKMTDTLKDIAIHRAIAYEQQALKIAEQAGLESQRHLSFLRLADCYDKAATFDKVLSYLRKCNPDLLETTFDKYFFHRSYGTIMARNLSDDSARVHYDIALQLSKELNDERHQANVYKDIANMLMSEHRFSEAIVYYIEGLERFRRVGDKRGEASVLGNIALTQMESENFQKALDYALEAKAAALKSEFKPFIGFAYTTLASCHQALHQYEEALNAIQEAIIIFSKMGYSGRLQTAYEAQGKILLSLGRREAS
jgi:tetratricopeptide (TPR) repeat protein